jgi:hypothetical protein
MYSCRFHFHCFRRLDFICVLFQDVFLSLLKWSFTLVKFIKRLKITSYILPFVVVWKHCNYGLVGRSVAKWRICKFYWISWCGFISTNVAYGMLSCINLLKLSGQCMPYRHIRQHVISPLLIVFVFFRNVGNIRYIIFMCICIVLIYYCCTMFPNHYKR